MVAFELTVQENPFTAKYCLNTFTVLKIMYYAAIYSVSSKAGYLCQFFLNFFFKLTVKLLRCFCGVCQMHTHIDSQPLRACSFDIKLFLGKAIRGDSEIDLHIVFHTLSSGPALVAGTLAISKALNIRQPLCSRSKLLLSRHQCK